MDKKKISELIIEHKERFLTKSGLIRREIQDDIENHIKQREVILITGIRRGGKSSLMRLLCDDLLTRFEVPVSNILYLNFEDERFVDFSLKDFEPLYEAFIEIENPRGRKYLFLDEIQNIKGWEKWTNRLYEFENVKIFITGSNTSLLGSEVSTALTGRNRQIVNWPFSFREFLNFKDSKLSDKALYTREKRAELKRYFREYFEMGGFPEVLKGEDTDLLEQYFKDIIYRDVIARYSIRNLKEIKELALFLASNIGTIQSYQNLKNFIGVKSLNTVKNYLGALNDVFLFFFIDLFDFSIKRQIYNPSKVYCIDTALSNAISFKFSHNAGRHYENIVFLELKRRKDEVYYWRSRKGREVDFIIKKGMKIDAALQVCLSLTDRKVKEREIEALKEANEVLSPNQLIIITEDEEGEEKAGNTKIKVVPLWKWLIN